MNVIFTGLNMFSEVETPSATVYIYPVLSLCFLE